MGVQSSGLFCLNKSEVKDVNISIICILRNEVTTDIKCSGSTVRKMQTFGIPEWV